jgi:hypothetical protein
VLIGCRDVRRHWGRIRWIPGRNVRWYRQVRTLIGKTFFCEMSKCEVGKRQLNEASDFFAGKTETKTGIK